MGPGNLGSNLGAAPGGAPGAAPGKNPFDYGGLVSGLGGLFGGLFGHNNGNPADAAMQYYNQIPGTLKPYYDKYINAGGTSLDSLMGQFSKMLSDPGSIMKMAGSGYQQSPGYKLNYDQGMNAQNSAAAAGGMLGTPGHQQQAGRFASDLANQDYNTYLNQALGLYSQGIQGQQGINQMGYNASDTLAQSLASNLMNQGNIAYQGQANKNQSSADRMNSIFGGLGGLASLFTQPRV